MLSKLQKLREEREQGFTLIELLVVILIIGILAAIAIPAFLNQRKSAVDSTAESDAKNVATAIETAAIQAKGMEKGIGATEDSTTGITDKEGEVTFYVGKEEAKVKLSQGNKLSITGVVNPQDSANAFTVTIKNDNGSAAKAGITYDSATGGLAK